VLWKESIFHIKYGYKCIQLGRHECIVLLRLEFAILCFVECTDLLLSLCFSIFKTKVLLLPCRWRQQFTPKRRYPHIKALDVVTRKVCILKKILTARILSRKIFSEEIRLVDPFSPQSFERCYTLVKRGGGGGVCVGVCG